MNLEVAALTNKKGGKSQGKWYFDPISHAMSQEIKTQENNTIDSKVLVKLDLKSKYPGV